MELSCAVYVGWQFRARPLNSVFQHMQEFGLHLVRATTHARTRARTRTHAHARTRELPLTHARID
jgi:hypothetical protein